MILCEKCIHWQGGRGVQKGVSLCRAHKGQRYAFPEKMGGPHGYAPKNKRCFTDTPPAPVRKKRVRVKRRVTR